MVPQVISALLAFLFLSEAAQAHDIYTHLKSRSGESCCDNSDCRPAPYRTTSSGVEMLVGETWVWVPRGIIEYRMLEGDTGETNGGHWCGERYDGGFVTYCAFLPPNLASSRLLKNSFAFGDEAGVIAVVDEDVPDEPPGGA
jgi:hypothetical protein